MHVGFTGTRKGMTLEQKSSLFAVLNELAGMCDGQLVVHHGDCVGADSDFHNLVSFRIVVHPPRNYKARAWCEGDEMRNEKDYIARNHDIVDESACLIATPDGNERLRSGTWATVRYAKATNKYIWIIYPDGTFDHFYGSKMLKTTRIGR